MSAVHVEAPPAPAFTAGEWVTTNGRDCWRVQFIGGMFPEGRLYGLAYGSLKINAYEGELSPCAAPPLRDSLTPAIFAPQPATGSYRCADLDPRPGPIFARELTPIPGSYFTRYCGDKDAPDLVQLYQRVQEHGRELWLCTCDKDDAPRIMQALALLDAQADKAGQQ